VRYALRDELHSRGIFNFEGLAGRNGAIGASQLAIRDEFHVSEKTGAPMS